MRATRPASFATAVAVSFLVASSPAFAANAFDLAPGQRLLAPISHKNLSIFPVVLSEKPGAPGVHYLTLAEGLKTNSVAVEEQKNGGTVNSVNVGNKSDRPLLLLAGEVILGGQQDRVIGEDTIIQPHADLVVPVFCVEHGRWSGKVQFTSTGGFVDSSVRMKAKYAGNQQQVWDAVAKKNQALKVQNATGTYRSLATGAEGKAATQPFRDAIAPKLAALPEAGQLIGLVAAVNGRVTSVDVFADPQLFAAYRERLLDSIFLAVADKPVTSETPPAAQAVGDFVNELRATKAEVKNGGGSREMKKGSKVVGTSLKPSAAQKSVYDSYQAVE